MNYHKKRRRTRKKAMGRVKATEKRLLKAIKANFTARGNVYAVPSVKRAMKLHNEALQLGEDPDRRRKARRAKRRK